MSNDRIEIRAWNDAQLRTDALHAAVAAHRFSVSAKDVVRTARTFYEFLSGEPEPQNRIVGWRDGVPFYASDRAKTVAR